MEEQEGKNGEFAVHARRRVLGVGLGQVSFGKVYLFVSALALMCLMDPSRVRK